MGKKVSINLPDFSHLLKVASEKTANEIGFKIEETAKKLAPVDTGYYRNQIYFDGVDKIIANAEYSAAIEYGVKKKIIKHVSSKVLHFKINNKDVFPKYAIQPAWQPNPVMRNAAITIQKQVCNIFKKHFG